MALTSLTETAHYCTSMKLGGRRYSDSRYSDISEWVRVRVRVRVSVRVRVKVTVRVRVSVSCAFSEAFVRIAAVGIAACTP